MNQNGKNTKKPVRRPAPQPKAAARSVQNKTAVKKAPQTSAQARPRPQRNAQAPRPSSARRTIAPAQNVQTRPQRQIDRTIKAQTPSQRQAQRSGKRITGSVKNMEVRHSTKTTKTQFRVKKKKPTLRLILTQLAMFLICFAIIFGAVCALFFLNLTHITGIVGNDYDVCIGEDGADSTLKYRSSSEIVGANGTYNISIDKLRKLCEFTVTGEDDILRYIPRGSSDQSVSFVVGTDIAYINGVMIHMESPSFMWSNQLHVPISFFKNYVTNLQVTHNPSEDTITVKRSETPDSAADINKDPDEAVFEPIIFLLSENTPLPNITEESVDES